MENGYLSIFSLCHFVIFSDRKIGSIIEKRWGGRLYFLALDSSFPQLLWWEFSRLGKSIIVWFITFDSTMLCCLGYLNLMSSSDVALPAL
jgi:hypothetical protein